MDSDSSDTNLVIITRRVRVKQFLKLYWKTVVILMTPFFLLPVYFIAENNAYKTLYVFSITIVYWIGDVMHPGIISLIPITINTFIGTNMYLSKMLPVGNEIFDCLSIMIIVVAIENCNLHRRIAVKLLLTVGCSHYRLSLMLFFCTMFLSMWLTDIIACGLMMPILKAILAELEKLGILEMHYTTGKIKHRADHHEQKVPKPTDFTVFYFLGMAYSASIGGMATIIGSQSNQIFKMYCESLFPLSPKIEFPHIILLNLPGVLLMEGLLYVWMSSYFLGMFRTRNVALEIGLTDEEAEYIKTLLSLQYNQLGKISFHEAVVGVIMMLTCVLQISFGYSYIQNYSLNPSNLKASAPTMMCVLILFVTPINLEFIKFFKRGREPLPLYSSKSCLNWKLIQNNVNWSVLFVIVGSSSVFSSLSGSGLLYDAGNALLTTREWPAPVLALLVVLLCKLAGEVASNATVVYCLLPSITRLCVASSVNPHYLMLPATMASSLPFHLITGSPVNAMVAAYVHIPSWKMMSAGIGPSVIAVVVVWFTVVVWSKAIWTDIHLRPRWGHQLAYNMTF